TACACASSPAGIASWTCSMASTRISVPHQRHAERDEREARDARQRDRRRRHAEPAMVVDQERRRALAEDDERDRPRGADLREHEREAEQDHEAARAAEIERPRRTAR